MQIIPVLDILNGVVVRGIAGQRERYEPVQSAICYSADPLEVASVFRERFGLETIYVADLDAIQGRLANISIYEDLRQSGFELLVDAGVRQSNEVQGILANGASKVIIGLETWPLLSSLELLMSAVGPEQLMFSLDMKQGKPLQVLKDLASESESIDIGIAVLSIGIREMIVLDLASVGVNQGVTTLDLCDEFKSFAPRTRIITGGGVRDASDLETLQERGIDGVLIASALHDQRVSINDVKNFA
jgi:phosphoribosylformimino-5-aminoimidazole carboxamide ribotide isomerase